MHALVAHPPLLTSMIARMSDLCMSGQYEKFEFPILWLHVTSMPVPCLAHTTVIRGGGVFARSAKLRVPACRVTDSARSESGADPSPILILLSITLCQIGQQAKKNVSGVFGSLSRCIEIGNALL
jgi:hypothetical protein